MNHILPGDMFISVFETKPGLIICSCEISALSGMPPSYLTLCDGKVRQMVFWELDDFKEYRWIIKNGDKIK